MLRLDLSSLENGLRFEQGEISLARRCLCDLKHSCCNENGMCAEERILVIRTPRRQSGAFKSSIPPQMSAKMDTKNNVFELLPVILE